jgi:hypothetical protein
VFYNETRKLVLKGVDGVVFVADSQQDMLGPNVESFKNLEENLKGHGLRLAELPHVIQFNKRDLPKLSSIEEINASVNKYNAPFYESVATTGIGVKDTLNAITKLVLLHLTKKYGATAPATGAQPVAAKAPLAKARVATTPEAQEAPVSEVPVGQAVPVSAAAPTATATIGGTSSPVTVGPMDDLPNEPPPPKFADDEIDDLVGEVQGADMGLPEDSPEAPPVVTASVPETTLESPESLESVEPVESEPLEQEETVVHEAELELTEAASDDDLFQDPDLEVARLATGQAREIVIPVEVGDEQTGTRRFKLSLRLRLDPVD